jgi:hypothetical protein
VYGEIIKLPSAQQLKNRSISIRANSWDSLHRAWRPFRSKAAGTLESIGHAGVSNLEQVTVAIDTNRHQSVGESRTGSQRRKTFGASGLRALSWLVPVLLVVICEAVAESGWLSPQVLPAPSKVLRTSVKRHRFRTSHPRQRLYTGCARFSLPNSACLRRIRRTNFSEGFAHVCSAI